MENADDEPATVALQLGVPGTVRSVTPEPIEVPAARDDPALGRVPGRRQVSFPPIEQTRDAIIEVSIEMVLIGKFATVPPTTNRATTGAVAVR